MFGRLKKMKATSFLQPQIDVQGADEFSGLAVPPNSCNTKITPSCLRTLYNTINYKVAAANVNQIGIAGYLGEFANFVDLQVCFYRTIFRMNSLLINEQKTFFGKFRTDAVGQNFTVVQIVST
jgi:tripeptidyl-peptidase-1